MGQIQKILLIMCLLVIIVCSCATQTGVGQDKDGNPYALTAGPASVFTECKQLSFSEIDKSLFKKDWYAVPVTSGKPLFNPLFLAFKYTCSKGEPDNRQSLTFPSLLAFKFDFVPDNFYANHPFFIFRKNPGLMELTLPGKEQMLAYCKAWDATHVISGEIIQDNSKYSGSIRVYDAAGSLVYEKNYKTPENYFGLMGKMVQGWMEYRKQKTTPGLLKELNRSMVKDLTPLRWLGETFSTQWGSAEEWAIYDKILAYDPGFGEVQYWYANQKGMATGNNTEALTGKGKALADHPVIPALREFSTELCLDDKLNAGYTKTVQSLEPLLGAVPLLAYLKLKDHGKSMTAAALDAYIPLALQYPSYYSLLELLAYQYYIRNQYEKALPLFLSALDAGYKPDDGKFDSIYTALSGSFRELGYINEAANFCLHGLNYCRESRRPYLLEILGNAFGESFIFSKAAELLKESYLLHNQAPALLAGYMNLYQAGADQVLSQWENDPQTAVLTGSLYTLVDIRRIISRGYYYPAKTMLTGFSASVAENFTLTLEAEITAADLFLLHKQAGDAKIHTTRAWYLAPRNRKTAFLVEKSYAGDLISLGYYAETANLIFKGDPYYKDLLQRAKQKGYIPYKDNILVTQYNQLAARQTGLSGREEKELWQSFTPFAVEYLALRMIRMNNAQYREAAVRLFTAYSKSVQAISRYQEIHVRTFFRILIADLSKAEKAGWIDVFESELSGQG